MSVGFKWVDSHYLNLTLWFYFCLLLAGFGGRRVFPPEYLSKIIILFFLRRKNQAKQKRRMENISSVLHGKRKKKCKQAISSQDSCPGSPRCVEVCPEFLLHPESPQNSPAPPSEEAQWVGDGWSMGTSVTLLSFDGFIKLMQPDKLNHLLCKALHLLLDSFNALRSISKLSGCLQCSGQFS